MEIQLHNDHQVPFKAKAGYFFGSLTTACQVAIPTFLVFYGTQNLALSIISISLMMTLVKILDGVTDIVAGFLIDKTRTKKGKARPWFLWVSIPYGLFFALQFCIPASWGPTAKLLGLAVTYALTVSVFGTLLGIAGKALLPRMTSSPKERGALAMFCGGAAATVIGLLMAIVFPITGRFGFTKPFIVMGVISFVLCILCYLLVEEQDIEGFMEGKNADKMTLKALFNTLAHNKYALLVMLYVGLNQMGGSILQGCGTYYATYVLGDPSMFSKFMLCGTAGSLVAMFIGVPIVKRIGTKRLFATGALMAVVAFLVCWAFGQKSNIVVMVVYFFAMMGCQTFTMAQGGALSAAAVDYGEWKTGVRAEGVTGCLGNFGTKVGGALGTAIMGFCLGLGGFVEGGVAQTPQAIQAINTTMCGVMPLIYLVLAVIFIITYKLEKQLPGIQADLVQRRMAAAK